MKVLITIAGIGILGALIMPIAPVAGGILISFCIFLLVVAIAGHSYGVEKKKWLEEEQEARRAQAEAQPVPPPADGSPATATPGIGIGNDPEVPTAPAWMRKPAEMANERPEVGEWDSVKYCTPVAVSHSGNKGLELEINE